MDTNTPQDLQARLRLLEEAQHSLRQRQEQQEGQLQAVSGITVRRQLTAARDRLRQLTADGQADPQSFLSATTWAEMLDVLDELRPLKHMLPGGLFRKVWMSIQEVRKRLDQDPRDAYALGQLDYAVRALTNAIGTLQQT